jgi:uncharacterized protein YndB with AHSA1/START domain
MAKLFVQRSIQINAPVMRVWDVLTRREYTSQWAPEFSGGAPFYLESDWEAGSTVLWKGEDGRAIVEGTVTTIEPGKLLRYTVFDVRSNERPAVNAEDGITWRLREENGNTVLDLMQGDFSGMPDGAEHHEMSAHIWDRVLPKVKDLAEEK